MNLEKMTWYVARSGGIVAWCLLALGMVLGLVLSSRVLGRKGSPAWILSMHRFLGGLGVIFTAIHVVAIMLDDFVEFGVADVLVPFASSWQPWAVAWGIVAMYLMLAIELTSLVMKHLPKRLWRWVHWTSAGLFGTATLHGFLAGTDAGRSFILVTVAVVAVLAGLTTVRVRRARRRVAERTEPTRGLDDVQTKRRIRPSPPAHVLDSLTIERKPVPVSQPEPVMAAMPMPNAGTEEFDWQPPSAPPQPQPALAAEDPHNRAVAIAPRVTAQAPPVAEVSSQPEWDRPTPPPEPPQSIEDALPEVPWSMPVPDIGGPRVSPGRWRPRDGDGDGDSGFFGQPPDSPRDDQRLGGEDDDTVVSAADTPATISEPPTTSGPTVATPEPPKPNWDDPPTHGRRPGPAPGVWKRPPRPDDDGPPTWSSSDSSDDRG